MKRLNIYGAFVALAGPVTKEDITIQLAKQQNIRFNDLPQLQREVDRALDESLRLGFVDREGTIYKLNRSMPSSKASETNKMLSIKSCKEPTLSGPSNHEGKLQAQGDGVRSTKLDQGKRLEAKNSSCTCMEFVHVQQRRKTPYIVENHLRKNKSVCSICGVNSDKCSVCDQRGLQNGF